MPPQLNTVFDYMRRYAGPMGARIMEAYPPLHAPGEPASPRIAELKRTPLAAQELAIMGTAKYLKDHAAAKIVGEMGTGKSYMGASACYVHANGRQHTGIVMAPPHLTLKWSREIFLTVPNTRVFLIEDMRNGGDPKKPHGVVEVKLIGSGRDAEIVRRGEKFSLAHLRELGSKGFKQKLGTKNAWFVMSKERGKLSYYWRQAAVALKSNERLGYALNPETWMPVELPDGGILTFGDLASNNKRQDMVERPKGGTEVFAPLWSADNSKIQRMAPLEFMGRYMKDWFDYAIADELHQLSGDTAQGNGLGVLARVAKKLIGLTGTSFDGYADSQYNSLYRMDGPMMARDGFQWGAAGRKLFQSTYGVIEEIRKRKPNDGACSKKKEESVIIKRRPGCSPILFGKYFMESTAFVSLEDIAKDLPEYNELPIPIEMDDELRKAYDATENTIRSALRKYPKNPSITSLMLQTLLCYPDSPFDWKMLKGKVWTKHGLKFIDVVQPANLSRRKTYAKEKRLVEDIKKEVAEGRKVQVFATFTVEHDVPLRLKTVLEKQGLKVAVMRASVPTEKREAWYAERSREGVQVVICHPKLVETGLDLLEYPTIAWYETGYSLHTLRQASRRSWRIGQKHPVRVLYYYYAGTAQERCVRLMGKKLLVSLMMEGKVTGEGLEDMDDGDDMVTALVKELLHEGRVGESADDVWKNLARERKVHMDAAISHDSTPQPTSEEVDAVLDQVAAASDLVPESAPMTLEEMVAEVMEYADSASSGGVLEQHGLAAFAMSRKRKSRRKPVNSYQLRLF